MNEPLFNPCRSLNPLPQSHLRKVQPILFESAPSVPKEIRIHAVVTADSDGTHSAANDHPDVVNDKCGFKYKIEKEDIKRLVDGANEIFSAASIKFLFDPSKDVEFRDETLLNRDSLTPAGSLPETQHVFYRDGNGNIHELFAGQTWQSKNRTQEASAPPASSSPAVYQTDDGATKHVVYRGVDGHIHKLSAGSIWKHDDLTLLANAPPAAGAPFGYTTFDDAAGKMNIQHVVYRGHDGHIHELFARDTWQHNVLTALAGSPLAAGDPFGYVTVNLATERMEIQHVVYRGVDGHIHELFTKNRWTHNALTLLANAPLAAGEPSAYTTNYGDVQHVIYRGVDGHIHELFAGNTWKHNNLTSLTKAPLAAGDPVGYTTNDYNFGVIDHQHVVYRGIDKHIHELFTVDEWKHNDLTSNTHAPAAASDPTAYTDGSKQVEHVIYRDDQGHIHELFTGGETWTPNDLTERTQAPVASLRPFGYSVSSDALCGLTRNRTARAHRGQLVVYFRFGGQGWSNSTDEFVVMPSVWNPNDLTFLAHEIGHYFHLGHTFSSLSAADAASNIKNYVEGLARDRNNGQLPEVLPDDLIARGLEAIDADSPWVTDTPAELQLSMKDDCNPNPHIPGTVVKFFHNQLRVYVFRPDSQNVMNYTPKDGKPAHFSAGQIARIRDALERRNRQHLM